MTAKPPPADTSWLQTPEVYGRSADVDDDVPTWLVVLVAVLAVVLIVCAVVVSAAGYEAYLFFHHQNSLRNAL